MLFKKNQTVNIFKQFEKSLSSTCAGSGKQTDTTEEKQVLGEISFSTASAAASSAEVSDSQAAQSSSKY